MNWNEPIMFTTFKVKRFYREEHLQRVLMLVSWLVLRLTFALVDKLSKYQWPYEASRDLGVACHAFGSIKDTAIIV